MSVIYVLLVAHFVADFLAQSDWMALNKSKRWDALALHVAAYGLVLSFIVGPAVMWFRGDPGNAWAAWLFANLLAHFVQDAITSRINARLWFLRETECFWRTPCPTFHYEGGVGSRHWFFVSIGFDQLLHYVVLFVTAEWWLL